MTFTEIRYRACEMNKARNKEIMARTNQRKNQKAYEKQLARQKAQYEPKREGKPMERACNGV